jgi:hypothetical protein
MIIWYFNPIEICHLSFKKANSIYCISLFKKTILSFFSLRRQTLPPLLSLSLTAPPTKALTTDGKRSPPLLSSKNGGTNKSNCSLFGSSLSHVLASQAEANGADAD